MMRPFTLTLALLATHLAVDDAAASPGIVRQCYKACGPGLADLCPTSCPKKPPFTCSPCVNGCDEHGTCNLVPYADEDAVPFEARDAGVPCLFVDDGGACGDYVWTCDATRCWGSDGAQWPRHPREWCVVDACFAVVEPGVCELTFDGVTYDLVTTDAPEVVEIRACQDKPGETCVSCWTTAVTVSCTIKVRGYGCTIGNHINFGGWVICS